MNDSDPLKPDASEPEQRWHRIRDRFLKPVSPWQFSLRMLLLLVLAVAVFMSWFSVKMRQARKQRETVQAIVQLGGEARYDYEVDADGHFNGGEPQDSVWLRELLGNDFFSHVVLVDCPAGSFGDDEMARLERLTNLQYLHLHFMKGTDAALEHLEGLTNLRLLCLMGADVTDAGLEQIEGLSSLQGLDLRSTEVTDEGVKKLQEALPDCKIIR